MNRFSPMKSLVVAGAGFALTSLALLSAGTGGDPAQAQALANHNSNAPVDFAANSIEVQDRADRVVISGNVRVTQAGMTLTAARMTVAYSRQGGTDVNRLDATGGVVVTKGDERASGNVAIEFDECGTGRVVSQPFVILRRRFILRTLTQAAAIDHVMIVPLTTDAATIQIVRSKSDPNPNDWVTQSGSQGAKAIRTTIAFPSWYML